MKSAATRKFMRAALASARKGIQKGEGGPFGACIVKGGRVIAVAHNTVLKHKDATCHAEVNAIRMASRALKKWDLKGCVIYSTTEPCPMCFSAIHWANIGEVAYGTEIPDVRRLGFNELTVSAPVMKRVGGSHVKIRRNFMRKECLALLQEWKKTSGKLY